MNKGGERAVRVCAALVGATGKEIAVDRTTYGGSLSKPICRALVDPAKLGPSSVVRLPRE